MKAKEKEFHQISMGNDRVHEYTNHFTRLLRYAPAACISSETEKMYYYHEGLSTRIKLALSGKKSRTLRQLIDRCMEIEKDRMEADALRDKKERKHRPEGSLRTPNSQRRCGNAPPQDRHRFTPSSTPGSSRGGGTYTTNYPRPAQSYPVANRPAPARPAPTRPAPNTSNWKTAAPTPTGSGSFTCFGCGQPGHKVAECPLKVAVTGAQNTPYKGTTSRGRLTHLTAEDAQTAPDMVYGMFLVQGTKAYVLFDSGATCSYISSKFA